MLTFQEVGLEVDIKDVPAETFDGIVKGQYMNAFSVFDIKTLVNIDKITKFHTQIVTGDFVHLNSALLYVIRTQADENGISALLSTVNRFSYV